MARPLPWLSGVRIGLIAAVSGILVLLLVGLMSGRGDSLIAEAGARMLPYGLASSTGLSAGPAYLVVHTAFYLVAGLAGVLLTRVADRATAVMTGLILLIIIVEFGFLVFSTEAQVQGRLDLFAWRAILGAHALADLVFAILLFRSHPSLLADLRQGYET